MSGSSPEVISVTSQAVDRRPESVVRKLRPERSSIIHAEFPRAVELQQIRGWVQAVWNLVREKHLPSPYVYLLTRPDFNAEAVNTFRDAGATVTKLTVQQVHNVLNSVNLPPQRTNWPTTPPPSIPPRADRLSDEDIVTILNTASTDGA